MARRNGFRQHAALCVFLVLATGCNSAISGQGTALPGLVGSGTASTDETGTAGSDALSSPSTDPGPTGSGEPDSHERWLPSETNPDPSIDIPGIYAAPSGQYANRYHFAFPDRVAYDRFPPVGGPHDPVWADCDGVVYDVAVRNENMVHSLEHGAVWIAYNPDTLSADDLSYLTDLVPQVSYLVMTPYPDLDAPLSLQSWAHQLKLDSTQDPRFEEFVLALLRNPYLTPEPNATCSQPTFDTADPPPFDPTPPGPDAIPQDFEPPSETTGTTTTG